MHVNDDRKSVGAMMCVIVVCLSLLFRKAKVL